MPGMNNGSNHKIFEDILRQVEKPARYVGGEWNSVVKEWTDDITKIAFAFPDVYEVGMSHLGLQILYSIINDRSDALMERAFAPWKDMERLMRENNLPLLSLETRNPLSRFNIIGFTLQYEMSYTNILNMMDLAGIPLHSSQRTITHPLVIAGGPCSFNPEPVADFIDAFVIGEGEEVFQEIIDVYRAHRGQEKDVLLRRLAAVEGVYVPALYQVKYNKDGTISAIEPIEPDLPRKVKKRMVSGFDSINYPRKPIVPNMGVVHDRIMLEVMRGCTRGCRFCQAGVIYRPIREKEPHTLTEQSCDLIKNTGYDEVSLVSLSSADYSGLQYLVKTLLDCVQGQGVGVSLPSLRVDAFSVNLAKEIQRVRRSSLTFAPEAGTQRLRNVINKGVTEQNLVDAVSSAFNAGWHAVKLYFMIGLPTEKQEDIEGIVNMARLAVQKGIEAGVNKGRLRVTVSISSFVPKSHTPFQWEPMNSLDQIKEKQNYLKCLFRDKKISYKWHEPSLSYLEGVFAKGDRRLSVVLEKAWELGCRFDGWSECFHYETWKKAFDEVGIDPDWYVYRRYQYQDVLPWDHIDSGVSKAFLINEHRRALQELTTEDCRTHRCSACGICAEAGFKSEILSRGGDGNPQI